MSPGRTRTLARGDAQLGGGDLLLDGVGAGSDVHGGADDGERPVSLGGQHGAAEAPAYLAAEDGDAAAAAGLCLCVSPPAGVEGGFQNLAGVDQSQAVADGVLLALVEDVHEAELGWVHAQLTGQEVRVRLQGKGVLVGSGGAEIAAGDGVGVDLEELEGGVGYPVAAADVVPGGEGGVGLHGAVGSAGVGRCGPDVR